MIRQFAGIYVHKSNIYCRQPAKKIDFREDHAVRRLEFVRENIFLPCVRILYNGPGTITLVKDNSAVHTSAAVRTWFAYQEEIEVRPWLSKLSNLNPIEILWRIM